MSTLTQRTDVINMVDEAVLAGASFYKACQVVKIAPSTLRRWRPSHGEIQEDKRPSAPRPVPANRLSDEERERIQETCNSAEFASLPPSQIVPIMADRGEYIGSESTIYCRVKTHGSNQSSRAR